MALSAYSEPDDVPNPTKKLRWATQRLKGKSGNKKRGSILGRLGHKGSQSSEKKRDSAGADSMGTDLGGITEEPEPGDEDETTGSNEDDRDGQGPRTVYFNQPLPPDAVDEQGHPLKHYRRNKIRTARYTPISFVPKNLWYQFHNIANVYFLFLIILTFFSIFGASNPGLNAVPLIVIVVITAIKDAIEDYRRTILDIELNNSPVHRLVDWNNVNVSEDDVSLWRRFKKACTRGVVTIWGKMKKNKKLPGKEYAERALDEPRESYETRPTGDRRVSAFSANTERTSFASARENIQMTPVPSPGIPRDENLHVPDRERPKTAFSYEGGDGPVVKNFGNLINSSLPVTGAPRFHSDYWKNVKVGDFVRIYNDDQIPADVVILSTSDPDGACYVETKNLDGETNLKVRHALRSGRKIKHARDCERTQFIIESEAPQPNLYQYSAVAR